MAAKLKKGDHVIVLSGRDKGKAREAALQRLATSQPWRRPSSVSVWLSREWSIIFIISVTLSIFSLLQPVLSIGSGACSESRPWCR